MTVSDRESDRRRGSELSTQSEVVLEMLSSVSGRRTSTLRTITSVRSNRTDVVLFLPQVES